MFLKEITVTVNVTNKISTIGKPQTMKVGGMFWRKTSVCEIKSLLGCNLMLSTLCEQLILHFLRYKIPTLFSLVWTGHKVRILSTLVLIVSEKPLAIIETESASTLRGT